MTNDKKVKKASRASTTRVKEEKPKVWTPPSSLDAPPAPDGYRHRWIRAESMGQDDSKNISGKMRSGWEFVRSDEYPSENYELNHEIVIRETMSDFRKLPNPTQWTKPKKYWIESHQISDNMVAYVEIEIVSYITQYVSSDI